MRRKELEKARSWVFDRFEMVEDSDSKSSRVARGIRVRHPGETGQQRELTMPSRHNPSYHPPSDLRETQSASPSIDSQSVVGATPSVPTGTVFQYLKSHPKYLEHFRGKLRVFASWRVRNQLDDIIQAAVTSSLAAERRKVNSIIKNPYGYLWRACRREAIKRATKDTFRQVMTLQEEQDAPHNFATQSPLSQLERADCVQTHLALLTDEERAIVVAHAVVGKTYRQLVEQEVCSSRGDATRTFKNIRAKWATASGTAY